MPVDTADGGIGGLAFVDLLSVVARTRSNNYRFDHTSSYLRREGRYDQSGRHINSNNTTTEETITITFRAVVLNTNTLPVSPGNQAGQTLDNNVRLTAQFTNTPAQPNAPTRYTVNRSGTTQTVQIVEPDLQISKGLSRNPTGPFATGGTDVDGGDVGYAGSTITNLSNQPTAYEFTLSDTLPIQFLEPDAYKAETGKVVTKGGADGRPFNASEILKVVGPKQARTIEVNDGFVHSDSATAEIELVSAAKSVTVSWR